MRHNSANISIIFLILALNIQTKLCAAQEKPAPIEVTKCSAVKKLLFEKEYKVSGFLLDADEIKYTENTCKQFAPFIVDGTPAREKEFPLMARLANKKGESIKWLCGGTLISEKFVLTAAHCFYTTFGDVNLVRLGALEFDSAADAAHHKDFKVRRNIIHDRYNSSLVYNDIALIELDVEVKYNEYIHPACLPTNSGEDYDKFLAIGWGRKAYDQAESNKLLKVKLNRFSLDSCKSFADGESEKFPRSVDSRSQFCAGSDDSKDTCYGDSGGPLLVYHSAYPCLYSIVGITSFGIGCGTPEQPGVYTRVHNYLDWIKDTVWK